MKRTIEKIVIHSSETPLNCDIRANDLPSNLKTRGIINFHYVIELDGNTVNTRPLHKPGVHCTVANANSIAICYIGGINRSNLPDNTMTPDQEDALSLLLSELRLHFPDIPIYGHNELDLTTPCPGFNVPHWLQEHDL